MRTILNRTTALTLVAVIAVGLAFYWYTWKPKTIRQSCAASTEEQVKTASEPVTPGAMNGLFLHCLHRNGLAN